MRYLWLTLFGAAVALTLPAQDNQPPTDLLIQDFSITGSACQFRIAANSPLCSLSVLGVSALSFSSSAVAAPLFIQSSSSSERFYLGFDRNIYPGDAALPILRKTFSFSSYWLNPPPGEKANTWTGKRELLRKHGFGFLVLFRGREGKDLKSGEDASAKGQEDAQATIESGQREGFGSQTIIYLDIEQGGRLSPNYHAYIIGWLWHLTPSFRGGFYCSGIPVKEEKRETITTCEDIFNDLWKKSRAFSIWAYNDMCPPSPGCTFPAMADTCHCKPR